MSKKTVSLFVAYGALVAMAIGQTKGVYSEVFTQPEYLYDTATAAPAGVFDRGAGFIYGPLRISPSLSVGYVHDSNPNFAHTDEESIDYMRARPELDILVKGNGWDVTGKGWMTHDWLLGSEDSTYADEVSQAHYGETLGFRLTSARGSQFSLTETYEYQDRKDVVGPVGTNSSWGDRYSFSMGALFSTPIGEYTGMSLGATYSDLWYDDPELFGSQSAGVSLGFNRKLSAKSDALLTFGYENQWGDGTNGQSRSYRVLAGFGSRPTAKTYYRAEVGAMGYSFNDNAETAASWTYSLLGNWQISQRLSAQAAGSASYQFAETEADNYTLVQTLSAGLTFEATSRLTTTLNSFYRREAYGKEDVTYNEKRLDNQMGVSARANYRLFRYTSVYAGATLSRNNSNISDNNYNRTVLESGVNVRF